jgi:hypothetical protein
VLAQWLASTSVGESSFGNRVGGRQVCAAVNHHGTVSEVQFCEQIVNNTGTEGDPTPIRCIIMSRTARGGVADSTNNGGDDSE